MPDTCVAVPGVNARTVTDIKILNSIFTESESAKEYESVDLSKVRFGYPANFWKDIGDEVCSSSLSSVHQVCRSHHPSCEDSVACNQ